MAYVALYRKYRSQSFAEVIGQEHVTTVLQNAIRLGRIAHAYLFCGPRGCGKTSTARLLARALNCRASDRPTPDPCGVCDMCVRIRDGSAMDVTEMDAASETGIDDVREKIIENAKYAPAEARYKVYIIDEVHDLSLKAFDSLLKTIEEPPAHVVFVLATTEAHKVPITIRSRCQRMDFRRATLEDLVRLLRTVLDAEGIACEAEAVAAIARAAEGSFRDSLSLLEQAMAYTDGALTAEAVHASVGTVGPQLLDSITEALASDDLRAAYRKAGELVDSGKDVKQTLVALQSHLRDLLVASIASGPQALADVSPDRFAQLQQQACRFSVTQLLGMLDILADSERELRFSNQHRLILERAFWNILPGSLAARAVPVIHTASLPAARSEPHAERPPADSMAPMQPSLTEPNMKVPAASTVPLEEPEAPTAPIVGNTPRFAADIDLDGIRRVWPRVVRRVTRLVPAAAALFTEDVQVLSLRGHEIVLGFPDEFKRSRVDKPKGHEAIMLSLSEETGIQGFKVRCVLSEEQASPPLSPAEKPAPLDFPPEPTAPSPGGNGSVSPPPAMGDPMEPSPPPPSPGDRDEDDFLTLVMEEFDGRLVNE